MRKLTLSIIIALIFMSVGLYAQETESERSETRVEKVLETKSIKEYNQWVKKNIEKYPALKPIIVDYTRDFKKSSVVKYDIIYYANNGDRIGSEIIENGTVSVGIPVTQDRILIYTPINGSYLRQTTVKNAKGEIVFTVPYSITYVGMELYVESKGFEQLHGSETELNVFNRNGQIINTLKGIDGVDVSNLCISRNGKFAVFEGGSGFEGVPIVFIDDKGKERWRQEFREGPISVLIAEDCTRIGIHHGKFVSVYLADGSLFREYNPFNEEYAQKSDFSSDGKLLVVGRASEICYYNNETGKLLWRSNKALAKNGDKIKFLSLVNNGERILVLCDSHNFYIFDKEGNLLYKTNFELGSEIIPMRVKRPDDAGFRIEGVEAPTSKWFAEFVGDYLIITKGKRANFESRPGPLSRIVYRIDDK